jgi:hypothetical protein
VSLYLVSLARRADRPRLNPSIAGKVTKDPLQIWASALAGYLGSRQLRLHKNYGYTLTLGETIIVCGMILFFTGKLASSNNSSLIEATADDSHDTRSQAILLA